MTRLEELEMAVASLPKKEYSQFRSWFLDRDWKEWDGDIEEDLKAGKLDFLYREAEVAKKSSRLLDI